MKMNTFVRAALSSPSAGGPGRGQANREGKEEEGKQEANARTAELTWGELLWSSSFIDAAVSGLGKQTHKVGRGECWVSRVTAAAPGCQRKPLC